MSREQMLADLVKVNDYLKYLGENQQRNFDVTGQSTDYLMPFFWFDQEEGGFVRPINHQKGLFMYYLNLRGVLVKAYKEGWLEEHELPQNAPKYLEELVR